MTWCSENVWVSLSVTEEWGTLPGTQTHTVDIYCSIITPRLRCYSPRCHCQPIQWTSIYHYFTLRLPALLANWPASFYCFELYLTRKYIKCRDWITCLNLSVIYFECNISSRNLGLDLVSSICVHSVTSRWLITRRYSSPLTLSWPCDLWVAEVTVE